MRKIILLLLLGIPCVFTGCKAIHDVQMAEHISHDTLYLSNIRYDSIYISDSLIERYRPSSIYTPTLSPLGGGRDGVIYTRTDTILKEKQKTEYRYRLLHDTTYIHHTDTIPKVIELTKVEKKEYTPPWAKPLIGIGIFTLIFLAIRIYNRIRHPT
ncbi:MAG: hypothetical protein MJZ60_09905 [Bacteroidaceae bacterium]|nr:hypothetical protein [Bacteroidaceae bacterium]